MMYHRHIRWGMWTVFVIAVLSLSSAIWATPYWTEYDYQKSQELTFGPPALVPVPPMEIPALEAYSYLHEYFQICHFLSLWQVSDSTSPNYGGMIEGETGSVANIIQTDNTQEAIRVWCQYAEYTNDLELYRHNIDAAWIYTMNFPAYSEEGAESDYYRVHNCGWALIAQMKYLDIYGDASYTQYADSCARYMQTHLLSFTPPGVYYQRLHPLVTGWAAGTLYLYGEYTGVQSYIDSALSMADRVIAWVEADPSRLNTTEVWAMSAGTAMWGICNSRFREELTYGQTWLNTYASYLDTWQSTGEWNNSWNVWYAHAYHYMYDITGDQEFHEQAVANVDALLAMDTDNDGGIMATSTDPDTVDQTWVSCYLDWMGIAKIIDSLEARDAGMIAILEPDSSLPYMVGDHVTVTVVAGNLGTDSLGVVQVGITGEYNAISTANLPRGGVDTVTFSPVWTPHSSGEFTLAAYTHLTGDQNSGNDSLMITVTVLEQSAMAGRISDAITQTGIESTLLFFHNLYPPEEPYDSTVSDPVTGNYQASLPTGEYRVQVRPICPYTPREWSNIQVVAGDTTRFNIYLTAAPLALVDDDNGEFLESWFLNPLQQLGIDTYRWDVSSEGCPSSNLLDFRAVLWFSGNASGQTLTSSDFQALRNYLNAGGNLLLTGQDLETSLEGDAFTAEYLHAQVGIHTIGSRFLNGVPGDPVSDGLTLLITGAGGAQNQNTPGEITAVSGGVECYHYNANPPVSGAVRYECLTYKSIVMTFGLEAVSGLAGTNSLVEVLESALVWFDPDISAPVVTVPIPTKFRLSQNYPNPFNMTTVIPFENPAQGAVSLAIYNVLGQRVRTLVAGEKMNAGRHAIVWDGCNDAGLPVSSGVYIYRLDIGSITDARKMVVLR